MDYWQSSTYEGREIVSEGNHNFLSFPLTGGSRSWKSQLGMSKNHGNVVASSKFGVVAIGDMTRVSLFRQDDLLNEAIDEDHTELAGSSDCNRPPLLPDSRHAIWTTEPGFNGPYTIAINENGLYPTFAVASADSGEIAILNGGSSGVCAGPFSIGRGIVRLSWNYRSGEGKDDLLAVVSSHDRRLRIFNGKSLDLVAQLENITCVSWHPDNASHFVAAFSHSPEIGHCEVIGENNVSVHHRVPAPGTNDGSINEEDYEGVTFAGSAVHHLHWLEERYIASILVLQTDEDDDEATTSELFVLTMDSGPLSWTQNFKWQAVRDCGDPILPFEIDKTMLFSTVYIKHWRVLLVASACRPDLKLVGYHPNLTNESDSEWQVWMLGGDHPTVEIEGIEPGGISALAVTYSSSMTCTRPRITDDDEDANESSKTEVANEVSCPCIIYAISPNVDEDEDENESSCEKYFGFVSHFLCDSREKLQPGMSSLPLLHRVIDMKAVPSSEPLMPDAYVTKSENKADGAAKIAKQQALFQANSEAKAAAKLKMEENARLLEEQRKLEEKKATAARAAREKRIAELRALEEEAKREEEEKRVQEDAARKAKLEKLRKETRAAAIEYQSEENGHDELDSQAIPPVELESPLQVLKNVKRSNIGKDIERSPYALLAAKELESLRVPLQQCLNFLQSDINEAVYSPGVLLKKNVFQSRMETLRNIFDSLKEQQNAVVLEQTAMEVEKGRLERMINLANIHLKQADHQFEEPHVNTNFKDDISPRASALREKIRSLSSQSQSAIDRIQEIIKLIDARHRGYSERKSYLSKGDIELRASTRPVRVNRHLIEEKSLDAKSAHFYSSNISRGSGSTSSLFVAETNSPSHHEPLSGVTSLLTEQKYIMSSYHEKLTPDFDKARQLRRKGARLLHHSGQFKNAGRHENFIEKKMRKLLCSLPSPVKSQAGASSSYSLSFDAESQAAKETSRNVQEALSRRQASVNKSKTTNVSTKHQQPFASASFSGRSGLAKEQSVSSFLTSNSSDSSTNSNRSDSGQSTGHFGSNKPPESSPNLQTSFKRSKSQINNFNSNSDTNSSTIPIKNTTFGFDIDSKDISSLGSNASATSGKFSFGNAPLPSTESDINKASEVKSREPLLTKTTPSKVESSTGKVEQGVSSMFAGFGTSNHAKAEGFSKGSSLNPDGITNSTPARQLTTPEINQNTNTSNIASQITANSSALPFGSASKSTDTPSVNLHGSFGALTSPKLPWVARIEAVLSATRIDPKTNAVFAPATRQEKLKKIPDLLKKYAGKEQSLLNTYFKKYNVPPQEQQVIMRLGGGPAGATTGNNSFGQTGSTGMNSNNGFSANLGTSTNTSTGFQSNAGGANSAFGSSGAFGVSSEAGSSTTATSTTFGSSISTGAPPAFGSFNANGSANSGFGGNSSGFESNVSTGHGGANSGFGGNSSGFGNNVSTGNIGANSGFGGNSSGFGSTSSGFGGSVSSGAPSAFGGSGPMPGAPSGFGSNLSTGAPSAFGSNPSTSTPSAFGGNASVGSSSAFGGTSFSSPSTGFGNNGSTAGAFGGSNAYGATSSPSAAFGVTQPNAAGTGTGFGGSNFGNTASSFGAAQLGTGSGFGSTGSGFGAHSSFGGNNPFGARQNGTTGQNVFGSSSAISGGSNSNWYGKISMVYQQYNPAKNTAAQIQKSLKQYAGRENLLMQKLFQKYKVPPQMQQQIMGNGTGQTASSGAFGGTNAFGASSSFSPSGAGMLGFAANGAAGASSSAFVPNSNGAFGAAPQPQSAFGTTNGQANSTFGAENQMPSSTSGFHGGTSFGSSSGGAFGTPAAAGGGTASGGNAFGMPGGAFGSTNSGTAGAFGGNSFGWR